MRVREWIRIGVVMGVLVPAVRATGADLPKEGSFTQKFYAYGTYKGFSPDKSAYFNSYDEDGIYASEGLFNHMTAHCFGTAETINGARRIHTTCMSVDLDGDQIIHLTTADRKAGSEEFPGEANFLMGTGKFQGITGGIKFTCTNRFKSLTRDSFYVQCEGNGSYKLP